MSAVNCPGPTHYAGCACHEAQMKADRDELLEALKKCAVMDIDFNGRDRSYPEAYYSFVRGQGEAWESVHAAIAKFSGKESA